MEHHVTIKNDNVDTVINLKDVSDTYWKAKADSRTAWIGWLQFWTLAVLLIYH